MGIDGPLLTHDHIVVKAVLRIAWPFFVVIEPSGVCLIFGKQKRRLFVAEQAAQAIIIVDGLDDAGVVDRFACLETRASHV